MIIMTYRYFHLSFYLYCIDIHNFEFPAIIILLIALIYFSSLYFMVLLLTLQFSGYINLSASHIVCVLWIPLSYLLSPCLNSHDSYVLTFRKFEINLKIVASASFYIILCMIQCCTAKIYLSFLKLNNQVILIPNVL